MLDLITPVLLTFNEELNIGRTLSALNWAKHIVVVDSGSTDSTLAILSRDPRIKVFARQFDTHANQWTFAVSQTSILTDWVFRLDADYLISDELREELARLDPQATISAYSIAFDYAVCGQRLRASLYPPKSVLFRRKRVTFFDQGHTEAWDIEGQVGQLKGRILHDDRKKVTDWIAAQGRYVSREFGYLKASPVPTAAAVLRRRPPLMPLLSFFYCFFFKGLILNGRAGMFYCLQRLLVETALSLTVLEDRLNALNESPQKRPDQSPIGD